MLCNDKKIKWVILYYHERTKFSAEAVDDYIKELKKGGHRVKAFFHCNPNNPLGDIYGEETTLNLMRVCKEHQIHFICDEIYALSIFKSEGRQKFKRQVEHL